MYNPIVITQHLADKLQGSLDHITMRFKDSDSTETYREVKPTVYAFTFDDLSNGYPLKTPSVLVQITGIDGDGTAHYVVYVCIADPATLDKEITTPVQGMDNVYQYQSGDGIDSACVRSELYRACVSLGYQIYVEIKRYANEGEPIVDVVFTSPSPYMESFPYAECTISFDYKSDSQDSTVRTELIDIL